MNETVLFCAYKSVLCEGMTLETQYLGSRPTRACELKSQKVEENMKYVVSRPTRACELKCSIWKLRRMVGWSRPTRACELKCISRIEIFIKTRHALHGRVS